MALICTLDEEMSTKYYINAWLLDLGDVDTKQQIYDKFIKDKLLGLFAYFGLALGHYGK